MCNFTHKRHLPEGRGYAHTIVNAWYRKGHFDQAILYYTNALIINPSDFKALSNRGDAWDEKGNIQGAINDYYSALEINPNHAYVSNNLAWIFATCKNEKYRNGFKAVELASKAVEIVPDEFTLSTLAAAYAEAGDFDDAIKFQNKAIDLIIRKNNKENIVQFEERLSHYKNRKPWREKRD